MPQKKQTDDEIYKTLIKDIENLEKSGMVDETRDSSNIELDEEDEKILSELYP